MLSKALASIPFILSATLAPLPGEAWAATGAAPVAAFTVLPENPAVKQIAQFTNASTGRVKAWSWSFGDGKTSVIRNPKHRYFKAGSYEVSLKATNAWGSSTTSHTVVVGQATPPPPTTAAEFACQPATLSIGQKVDCKDASTGQPTSWAWSFGDNATSSDQNPSHSYATAGSYTVTLTVTFAGGASSVSHNLTVMPANNPPPQQGGFNLQQTLSDGAQRTTLGFDGLALMTGNLNAQSFFPPGKVADYTGFQYLRDNDPDNMGHNTDFLTRIANNVIYLLNDDQFAQLKTLAVAQMDQISQYGYRRFTLMQAFRALIDGQIPSGHTALDLSAVKQASHDLYLIDGQISFDRALLYASILNSLDASQKASLDAMKGKGFNSWPNITNAQVDAKMRGLPQGTAVAVMTYAGDLFSWYAGTIDSDVYFCPERHGTYYGGFYLKDAPAVGHAGYSISEQLTATAGAALVDSGKGYVTAAQAAQMSSLVDTQRANLYAATGGNSIVGVRTQIATLLRGLLASTLGADSVKTQVLELSGLYGDLDGENNYNYATVFAQVYKTMTSDQIAKLAALRKSILSGTYADGTPYDFTTAATPFLYSQPISDISALQPYLSGADSLFY